MDTRLLANLHERRKVALYELGGAYYEAYKCSQNMGCDNADKDEDEKKAHRRELGQRVDECAREVAHIEWLMDQVREGKFHARDSD